MSIYVGNLSYEVNQEDLKEVFTEYGTVNKVNKARPREDRSSFGGGGRRNNRF